MDRTVSPWWPVTGTNTAVQTFNWNVNSQITFNELADQTNNENDSVSVAISAADSTGGTVTYAAQGLPPGLSISPSTGSHHRHRGQGCGRVRSLFCHGYCPGWHLCQPDGHSTGPSTSPIVITAPNDQTNNESDSVTLDVAATDAISGSTIVFSALGLPGGSLNQLLHGRDFRDRNGGRRDYRLLLADHHRQ